MSGPGNRARVSSEIFLLNKIKITRGKEKNVLEGMGFDLKF